MIEWLVIGIGGTTCSGKTTLSVRLHQALKNSVLINQDSYFLPEDDPRHIHIPELNHHNWDILESMDMEKMLLDVQNILRKSGENDTTELRVLIIDGILIFNHKPIADLCDVKYFLTLTKEQCWERRKNRVYDPPDVSGYFEKIVWPEYEKSRNELEKNKNINNIIFISGALNKEEIFQKIFQDISRVIVEKKLLMSIEKVE